MTSQQAPPLTALRRLSRIYVGAGGVGSAPSPLSLGALASELDVQLTPPPHEALVMVVGAAGSGKSAFVNALAQELVLPVGTAGSRTRVKPPLQWTRAEAAEGPAPRLLLDAASRFTDWPAGKSSALSACCAGRSASQRLDGVEIVEVAALMEPSDAEAIGWLATKADVIVCLLDSQRQPCVSDSLLQWLASLPSAGTTSGSNAQPALQFVMSKADLIPRESERIRLLAKASKLLTERFGRGFEVLPVAAGDLGALLDELYSDLVPPVLTVCGKQVTPTDQSGLSSSTQVSRKYDQGLLRAVRAAQTCAASCVEEGIVKARADCVALAAALASRTAATRARASSTPLRPLLLQLGGAFAIVAVAVPFVLDEDVDPWLVQVWIGVAALLAVLALLGAIFASGPDAKEAGKAPRVSDGVETLRLAACEEQERFLQLVLRQLALWAGDAPPPTAAGESGTTSAIGGGASGVQRRQVAADGAMDF